MKPAQHDKHRYAANCFHVSESALYGCNSQVFRVMLRRLGLAACCGRAGATADEVPLERQSTDAFVAEATYVGDKQGRCTVHCTYAPRVDDGKGRALRLVGPMVTPHTTTHGDKPSQNDDTARIAGLCEPTRHLTQSAWNTSCGSFSEQPSGDYCQRSLRSTNTAGRFSVPSSMAGLGMGSSMLSARGGTSMGSNTGPLGACVDAVAALGGRSGTLLTQPEEDESRCATQPASTQVVPGDDVLSVPGASPASGFQHLFALTDSWHCHV